MNKLAKWTKYFILALTFGLVYICVEVVFTALIGKTSNDIGNSYWSFMGMSSIWMMFVGAGVGITLGLMNEWRWWRNKMPMIIQMIIAGIIITTTELWTGLLLNKIFGLNVWDYSNFKFNFMGQIELFHGLGWIALSPWAFWLDDYIRAVKYDEGEIYSPLKLWGELIFMHHWYKK